MKAIIYTVHENSIYIYIYMWYTGFPAIVPKLGKC